jgi:hypothetical protein
MRNILPVLPLSGSPALPLPRSPTLPLPHSPALPLSVAGFLATTRTIDSRS